MAYPERRPVRTRLGRAKRAALSTISVAGSIGLLGIAGCSVDNSNGITGGSDENYVVAEGTEPQNPLIPTNTNEVGGSRIIDCLFAGLTYHDAEGNSHLETAESIDSNEDNTEYTVHLKDTKFSDGSPVTSHSFVDAWNFAVENSHLNTYVFEPIKGYEEGATSMEGLQVIDDRTFRIVLSEPVAGFEERLGYNVFSPLPEQAFDDIDAFGEEPIGNGPYKLAGWGHNQGATVVPNEEYNGDRKAQNEGVQFNFYASPDAAYADLLSNNLDVIEAVPDTAMTTYKEDLGDRAVNKPYAGFTSFTIPERLDHFSGEEGKLRRQAISHAIDRQQIIDTIFAGTKTPAKDFSSPAIPGYDSDIPGNEVTEFDPEKAKELWKQADDIDKWDGDFQLAYNSDGAGNKAWAEAVANSIKNVLGIEAHGEAYPDFKSMRDDVTSRTIETPFRTGWVGEYPSVENFLTPLYGSQGGSNDGDYSNPEFDRLLAKASGAKSPEQATEIYNQAQEILFQDLPVIPLWYENTTGGTSENVDNVDFTWRQQPSYYAITKDEKQQ